MRKSTSFDPETAPKNEAVVGFDVYNLPVNKWATDIKNGKLKGIVAVIGCENPRVKEDWIPLYKKLSKDHIILTTGCMAFKLGAEGLLDGERFFHLGSCVNNARVRGANPLICDPLQGCLTIISFMLSPVV